MTAVPVDERTLKQLRVLARFGDWLSSDKAVDELVAAGAALVTEAAGRWALVHRVVDGRLTVVAAVHPDPDVARALRGLEHTPGAARTFRDGEPRLLLSATRADVASYAGDAAAILERAGMTSLCSAPMRTARGTVGVLCVGDGGGPRLDEIDLAFVQRMADRIGTAVSRELLIAELARREQQARFLGDATRLLSTSLDLAQTLQTLADIAVPVLADWCTIEMVTPTGTPEAAAISHADPARVAVAREVRARYPPRRDASFGGIAAVVQTGKPQLVPVITDEMLRQAAIDDEQLRLYRALGLRSVLIVPLLAGERTLGTLTLLSGRAGRYGPSDVGFAEEVAARAAVAVENARLYGEARRAVALRDDFVAVASHELKTPLTALLLTSRALRIAVEKGRDPTVLEERAARLERQVARMEQMVAGLLDVTRIAGGRLVLELRDSDLGSITGDVVGRLLPQATAAGSQVRLSSAPGVHGRWDATRIEQVVTNVLSNAIKYGAGRPIDVVVDRAGQRARLVVRDHGFGIAEEDQRRIFEQFERAVPAGHFAGLGLGLWIARQVVEAHGGTIAVASVPGEGASFTVELPATGSA